MDNEWNMGQLLFGIQITLAGIAFAVAGVAPAAILAAIIGFLVCFSGLVARPRTGP